MAMTTLDTIVDVPESRTVTLQLPPEVTTGRHRIIVIIEDAIGGETPPKSTPFMFPVIPGGTWPDDMPMRREDLYGDDGR